MNKLSIIFPSSPYNPKEVDEDYKEEFMEFKNSGYSVYVIDIDNIENAKIYPPMEKYEEIIYRGWMMTKNQYADLNKKLNNQLKIQPQDYLNSHHLPNWYESVKDLTMNSFFSSVNEASNTFELLKNKGYQKLFIKDYVKSLKTGKGSIVDSSLDVQRALDDMNKYRGFIEEAIVFRQVIELIEPTEQRFFILNGKIFGTTTDEGKINILQKVVSRHNEFFFSVDLAQDKEGKIWLIEIGDGQVSGLTGWNVKEFVSIFESLKPLNKLKP